MLTGHPGGSVQKGRVGLRSRGEVRVIGVSLMVQAGVDKVSQGEDLGQDRDPGVWATRRGRTASTERKR